jgi:hypothetical protein
VREYIHLVFYNVWSSIDEFFVAIACHLPQGPQARISELGAVEGKDKEIFMYEERVGELSIVSVEFVLSICLYCKWYGSRPEIGIFEAFAEVKVCLRSAGCRLGLGGRYNAVSI